jgi:hypothetical protein
MDDCELVKLFSAGALIEGQPFAPGKTVCTEARRQRVVAGDPSPFPGGAPTIEPIGAGPDRYLRLGMPDFWIRA